jgi:hypothetical protein
MGLSKGQTNNPNGRPTGSKNKNTKAIRELIDDSINIESLIKRLDLLAKGKDDRLSLEAIKLIFSYRYGRPAQTLEINDKPQMTLKEFISGFDDTEETNRKISDHL